MLELKTNVRVRAEGLGITAKSFVTFLVLFADARRGQDTLALVAFALGQLAYAVVVFGHYTRTFGIPWVKKPRASPRCVVCLLWDDTTPCVERLDDSGYFDSALLNLSVTMTFQSVISTLFFCHVDCYGCCRSGSTLTCCARQRIYVKPKSRCLAPSDRYYGSQLFCDSFQL